MLTLSVILASAVPIVLILAFLNRILATNEARSGQIIYGKGMGWRFITVVVLATGLPIIAVLALNNALTCEAATIFAAAMGYAFGQSESKQSGTKGS